MAELAYTKRTVNQAGERLRAYSAGSMRPVDRAELGAAREIVEYWRGLHAAPLSKVAAGLRYYVRRVEADEPSVSQRLKRFDTIVEKLTVTPARSPRWRTSVAFGPYCQNRRWWMQSPSL